MGEIAEMMLDGDLCEGCGVYMGDPGYGLPRRCADCQKPGPSPLAKVKCPTCGKQVKAAGLADHQRDAHGLAGTPAPLSSKQVLHPASGEVRRPAGADAVPSSVFVVIDEGGAPTYTSLWPEHCHARINDALQEHMLPEAKEWVVREYVLKEAGHA